VGTPLEILAKVAADQAKEFGADYPALAACLSPYGTITGDGRTQQSVLAVAQTQTDWLDSPPIQRSLAGGAFDFATLKKTPTTVYLILPPNRLTTHATWLRLMISGILQPLLKSVTDPEVPVLMMLDEFAQMGHLAVIENNMGLMREYGVKLWPILQDLTQLKELYPKRWESFVGNAGVRQLFAPQDRTTSEEFSKLSGERIYWLDTIGTNESENTGPQSSKTKGVNAGLTHMPGPVYWPQGLRGMEDDQAVLFGKGQPRRTWLPQPDRLPGVCDMLEAAKTGKAPSRSVVNNASYGERDKWPMTRP